MLVNGKKIAEDICADIKSRLVGAASPCLSVFVSEPNQETKKYLEIKQRKAAELGIDMVLVELASDVSTVEAVAAVVKASDGDGIIVQLPFPVQVDVETLIAAIPKHLDVDGLRYENAAEGVLPPVVGAIAEIAAVHGVSFAGKRVVALGYGRLVGKPASLWAKAQGAAVTVVDKTTPDTEDLLKTADIIISGTGTPGLITPDKIKEGVIIFDAGTSEAGGQLKGDADPACADKAALFTPVPGGIGPITIALLFRNLLVLAGK